MFQVCVWNKQRTESMVVNTMIFPGGRGAGIKAGRWVWRGRVGGFKAKGVMMLD